MAKRWPLAFLLLLALALPGQLSAASNIYPPSNICDATTAGQCAAVSAAGAVSVSGTFTPSGTQAVSIAQLPAAAALADNLPNPTTTEVGADTLVWTGSVWARLIGPAGIDGQAAPTGAAAVGNQWFDSGNSVWRYQRGNQNDAVNGTTVGPSGTTYLYNGSGSGTGYDRQYNNTPSVAVGITCAACTSTQTGSDQTNFNGRGVRCTYDATIVTSVGSFTVEIDGKDEVSGKYYSLLTTTAVSTVSTNILTVYPGTTAVSSAPNFATSIPVPRTWRVKATFNSGTNQTFTIGCNTLV